MNKAESTRSIILGTALEQSVDLGLEGISLGKIAETVGMSKSGLFAHFKSKEGLQLAIIDEAIARFFSLVITPAQKKPEGLARLRAYFENYLDWIAGKHETGGCPFITYVQEFDDRSGAIRSILVKSQKDWRNVLAESVDTAISNSELDGATSPEQIAFEIIGAALAFQISLKLLNSRDARGHAMTAFKHVTS